MPGITKIESQGLRSYNKSDDLYLILPNVVYLGLDAYFDSKYSNKPAVYLELMPKLEECGTILRADAALMLPRLESGVKVFFGLSPQQYIYLPSLKDAGADFFKNAADVTAVWLPRLNTIDGGALAGSGINELYLGVTPPGVLNTGALASLETERTVYVPDDAVQAYKDANDGDTQDNFWYGFRDFACQYFGHDRCSAELLSCGASRRDHCRLHRVAGIYAGCKGRTDRGAERYFR